MRLPLLLAVAGLLSAADEWPQFRGNPQLTGVATGSVPANLKLLWTYDAGESIESSAAISGETVYVGSQSKDLLAIDLATGKLRWKYRATDSIGESSPAVAEGIVYVGDLAGILHAVNAADGKGLWTFKTEAEIRSSPAIAGDRLLIGSYDGNLYCLSRRDGKLVWKFTTSNYVHGTPAISDGVAYVSGCDEVFHGIRLTDGREVVEFPAGGPVAASPAMLGSGPGSAISIMKWWAPACARNAFSGGTGGRRPGFRSIPRRPRPATASSWAAGTSSSIA